MAEQHRATSDQWARVDRMCHHTEFSAILELRDRIEALEAAAKPNHPAKLDGSLVERVAAAMHPTIYAGPPYLPSPRAVIREVAAWLREHYGGPTATTDLLEQEAKLAALGDQAG